MVQLLLEAFGVQLLRMATTGDAAQSSPYAPAYVACLLILSGVVPIPGFGGLLLACGYTFGFAKGPSAGGQGKGLSRIDIPTPCVHV